MHVISISIKLKENSKKKVLLPYQLIKTSNHIGNQDKLIKFLVCFVFNLSFDIFFVQYLQIYSLSLEIQLTVGQHKTKDSCQGQLRLIFSNSLVIYTVFYLPL